jgi:excisionase family DNA binding protein
MKIRQTSDYDPFSANPFPGSDEQPGAFHVMTIRELAEHLRVSKTTVYRLLQKNALPAFKVGADWRFNVEQIEAWELALANARGTISSNG